MTNERESAAVRASAGAVGGGWAGITAPASRSRGLRGLAVMRGIPPMLLMPNRNSVGNRISGNERELRPLLGVHVCARGDNDGQVVAGLGR